MWWRRFGALAALGVFLLLPHRALPDAPSGATIPIAADPILPDPAVRLGVLPNGLRYAIMHNATPKGALSIRLGMDVGDFEESDGEHGVAHFIEHMAFSGGDNEHEAGPEKAFADAGVAFGRDLNADTSTFATVYRLDLPRADASSLDLAFSWLRRVADGAHFSDAAVNRERGIILAERATRLTPLLEASEATDEFVAPNLRSTRPHSIGTIAELQAIDSARLQAFYQRWYRPDNAVLIVIGDDAPDAIEARVRTTFASWTAQGAAPAKPAYGLPNESRGLEVFTKADRRVPPSLAVCRSHRAAPTGLVDVAQLRALTLTSLWTKILDNRLANLTASDTPPYLAASAAATEETREAFDACVYAALLKGGWQIGLGTVQQEIRRFAETGPSQSELDDAIDVQRATYRGAMRSQATRASDDLANAILIREMDRDVVAAPPELFRAFDVAVENVTPQDVVAAFKHDWSGSGPLIVLYDSSVPDPVEVRAAWTRNQNAPLPPPPPEPKIAHWGYDDFGKAGRVVNRQQLQSPDFVRLTFDNGVILNFKQTSFEKELVQVRVSFGAGRREIANKDFVAAQLGAALFEEAGLGKHDYQEIRRMFSQTSFDASLGVGINSFVLKGSTTVVGLKSQLQLLAAYVSDPGFRSTVNSSLPTLIDYYYRQVRADSGQVVESALGDALLPGGPISLPPEETLSRLRMNDFERLLKPAITQAPLEVTIVGDVDETVAMELVGATFGALPPRADTPRARGDTQFLRFPAGDLPTVHVTHEGPDTEAYVGIVWPVYVAVPERRREEIALTLLTSVFDNELRHRVRQELGKSYAPTVQLMTPDNADQGCVIAIVETSREDADTVVAEIRALALRLSRGEFSDESLEAARKPVEANLARNATSNDWWASYLDGSSRLNAKLVEMVQVPELVAKVTPAEVRKAAADWLARAPLVVLATPDAAAPQTSPKGSP
jgi:zinc protease